MKEWLLKKVRPKQPKLFAVAFDSHGERLRAVGKTIPRIHVELQLMDDGTVRWQQHIKEK